MLTGIELEHAIEIINQSAVSLGTERVLLSDALGRTLAEDIAAPLDQPPFDRSPLDGYALRAEDSLGASRNNPVELTVCDKVFAGDAARIPVGDKQAVRIMTGAMLPQGCDCVLRQEDTDMGEPKVAIYKELRPGDNYIRQGEDYRAGCTLLNKGTRLEAAELGVLAGAGIDRVEVRCRPRVSVLSTGSEIVDTDVHPLPEGKIYNANSMLLAARLKMLGMTVPESGLVEDSLEIMLNRMKKMLEDCDVLITTGGVSVGEKDLLHEALPLLGAKQLFWRVNLKPGTPVIFSRYQKKYILCLSGNPFAAIATFELLARPLLAALCRESHLLLRPRSAVLQNDFPKKSPGRRFIRATLEEGRVEVPREHSSGILSSLMGCNCLVDIPPGSKELKAGETVTVFMTDTVWGEVYGSKI